eukprot:COSAG01_NODE_4734_length_4785_cov_8.029236_5_plen_362_part_00
MLPPLVSLLVLRGAIIIMGCGASSSSKRGSGGPQELATEQRALTWIEKSSGLSVEACVARIKKAMELKLNVDDLAVLQLAREQLRMRGCGGTLVEQVYEIAIEYEIDTGWVAPGRTLWVGKLPMRHAQNKNQVAGLFERFGKVVSATVRYKPRSELEDENNKSWALVTFETLESGAWLTRMKQVHQGTHSAGGLLCLACLPAGCGTAGRCGVPPPLSTTKPIGAEVSIDAVLVCGWCGACTASAALRGEVVVEDDDGHPHRLTIRPRECTCPPSRFRETTTAPQLSSSELGVFWFCLCCLVLSLFFGFVFLVLGGRRWLSLSPSAAAHGAGLVCMVDAQRRSRRSWPATSVTCTQRAASWL